MTSHPVPVQGWYPDPAGRHDHRWWDGACWTTRVADAGGAFDERDLVTPPAATALPDAVEHRTSAEVQRSVRTGQLPRPRRPVAPDVDAQRGFVARWTPRLIRGRVDRPTYWRLYVGYVLLVAVPALVVSTFALLGFASDLLRVVNVFVTVLGLLLLPPLVQATLGRLDDAGESRWKLLLLLVPVVGWALLIIALLKPSARGFTPHAA